MAVEFGNAPEAQRIADELIPKHHAHLEDIIVRCVVRDKAAKQGGKVVYGKARKVDGLTAFLAYPDPSNPVREFFILEFARDVWATLDLARKYALVDHELCHCTIEIDDEGILHLGVRPHDVEEFREIIERHGAWTPDLVEFRASFAKYETQMDGQQAPPAAVPLRAVAMDGSSIG